MKKLLNKLIEPALVVLTIYGVWGVSTALTLFYLLVLGVTSFFFFFAKKVLPALSQREEFKGKLPSMVKSKGESGYWDYVGVVSATVLLMSGFWILGAMRVASLTLAALATETIIKTEKNDN